MPDEERNSFEKVLLAGLGAISKTAESASELLEDLVKKGELTVEQGKALNEELKHNIKTSVSNAAEKVQTKAGEAAQKVQSSAVSSFVNNMDRLTPEELAEIRAKMDELDNTKGQEE